MSGAAFLSSSHQIGEANIRLRPDLEVATIRRGLQTVYVVKDPVNLKYFEFDEHEFALIEQFERQTSRDSICDWFNRRFPPLRLTHRALQSLLFRLHRQGLVVSVSSGQGRKLTDRARELNRQEWMNLVTQPWVIRLPGIDPGPWIGIAATLLGWIYSPLFVLLAMIGMLSVFAVSASQYSAILEMSPDAAEFLSQRNLLLFGGVMIVTKILHEFGHAVVAHRLGCECHEMGVLLLAGLPSLYCDVSDAWMLQSRWKRIAISLGGIWMELIIATLAFVIWVASVPGWLHSTALDVTLVCSAGTLLFNANPLVKYDGYYVLMDLTGLSNLSQRSQDAVEDFLMRWVVGSHDERPLDEPEIPGWVLAYGIAAAAYRVFLTCSIIWGLHLVLRPVSLSIIVWMMAIPAFLFWSAKMIRASANRIRGAEATGIPRWRIAVGLTAMLAGAAAMAVYPLPWYVFGNAVLEPVDRQIRTATVAGNLLELRPSGSKINTGDLIARLENRDLLQEILQMQSELQAQTKRLEALQNRRYQDPRAAEQLPAAQASIAAVRSRLDYLLEQSRQLEQVCAEPSTIYPAPLRIEEPRSEELTSWSGSLFDPENRDAWANAGDAICELGVPSRLEAVAIVIQDDLESITVGQNVDLFIMATGEVIQGKVHRISQLGMDSDARSPGERDQAPARALTNVSKGSRKWYQIQIPTVSPIPEGTLVRSRCKIRIRVGNRSFAAWLMEEIYKTFRWRA